MKYLSIILLLLLPFSALADVQRFPDPIPSRTVGTLPACNAGKNGKLFRVTDCEADDTCATGGGTDVEAVQCENGTGWIVVGDGGGGGGEANVLASPDVGAEVDLINSVPKTGVNLNLVSFEADDFTVTSNIMTVDTGATAGIQAHDAELDTIAALTETNGAVMFVAGGAWTADLTPAIDCTDCTNVPAGAHVGTIEWSGTSILETGIAHQFGDGTDATVTHTYANTGTNVDIAYSTGAMAVTGTLTATNLSGTNTGDNDEVGTKTTGDLCINDGSSVNCTVNLESELETAMDALDIVTVTAGDISTANLMTLLSDEGASTTLLHGDGSWAQIGDADIAASAIDGGAAGEIQDGTIDANDIATGGITAADAAADMATQAELDAQDDFSEITGTVSDTQIAAGAVDGGAAGEIADGTIDSNDTAASLETEVACMYIENPVTAEQFETIWRAPVAVTVTEIYCETDAGTVGLDINIDDGTPLGINGSDISCASGGTADSTFGNSAAVAQSNRLDLDIGTVSTAVQVSVCWRYTYD